MANEKFVTIRFSFTEMGETNLEVGHQNFGFKTIRPTELQTEVVDFSPDFKEVKANLSKFRGKERPGGIVWINVKQEEPKLAAKRGKATAKASAKVEAPDPMAMLASLDPAILAALSAAFGKK